MIFNLITLRWSNIYACRQLATPELHTVIMHARKTIAYQNDAFRPNIMRSRCFKASSAKPQLTELSANVWKGYIWTNQLHSQSKLLVSLNAHIFVVWKATKKFFKSPLRKILVSLVQFTVSFFTFKTEIREISDFNTFFLVTTFYIGLHVGRNHWTPKINERMNGNQLL